MSNRETSLPMSKFEMYYYDEDSKTYKPLALEGGIPVHIVGGGDGLGGSKMNFLSGSGAPELDSGSDGDLYLNVDNGDLYKKESDWSIIVNLKGAQGIQGVQGEQGEPFTYEDFTPEQLELLKGIQGEKGDDGEQGEPFTYEDFTPTQLESLKGETGETGQDGFMSESEYDGLMIRLDDMQAEIDDLKN